MDWLKKHADTIAVLTAIFGCFGWMSAKFSSVEREIHQLDKDISIVKTVLMMKNIMPSELAKDRQGKTIE